MQYVRSFVQGSTPPEISPAHNAHAANNSDPLLPLPSVLRAPVCRCEEKYEERRISVSSPNQPINHPTRSKNKRPLRIGCQIWADGGSTSAAFRFDFADVICKKDGDRLEAVEENKRKKTCGSILFLFPFHRDLLEGEGMEGMDGEGFFFDLPFSLLVRKGLPQPAIFHPLSVPPVLRRLSAAFETLGFYNGPRYK